MHRFRHWSCDLRSMRRSGTCPVRNMLQPMIGMRKLLSFEMYLSDLCRWYIA